VTEGACRPTVVVSRRDRLQRGGKRKFITGEPTAMLINLHREWLVTQRLVISCLCSGAALAAQPPVVAASTGTGLNTPIVLTQVPVRSGRSALDWNGGGLARSDWFDGARLVLVSPDGQVSPLSAGFHSACDPNVSFDGRNLLFAGKQRRQSAWRIWEAGLDGRQLRPITPEHLNARSPIHVSTLFTLDSREPWFTAVFVAAENTVNEAGLAPVSSLYNIKLDGTELRRLTFSPNNDFDPFQMWDGRVIYSAERYSRESGAGSGRVGLCAIHLEGADMEFYGGESGGRIQQMSCATERGRIVFVESERATRDGAGQLACIEEQRPHRTYQPLTKDAGQVFLYPSPLRDNCVLVSRKPAARKGSWGVFRFDLETQRCEAVFDDPHRHDVQAVAVQPGTRPDGHSTVVNTSSNTGTFYALNCYETDSRLAPHLQPGMIKRIRLIEGVPRSASRPFNSRLPNEPFVPRRLIGEAPVEADGSFNVEVPADTPLLLQILDERGLALRTCGWIWVKPKETRGCIGCHEDPERIPENQYVMALRRPSNRLTLPPDQRRVLAFREDIAPLLQKYCATADCHGGKGAPLRLLCNSGRPDEPALRKAYAALSAPAEDRAAQPGPAQGKYLDAGRARTSPLIWQLTGANTSRPWDTSERQAGAGVHQVTRMPPPGKGDPLTDEEIRTVAQWIDMGAPYQGPEAARMK
jgi:hypothetical protein